MKRFLLADRLAALLICIPIIFSVSCSRDEQGRGDEPPPPSMPSLDASTEVSADASAEVPADQYEPVKSIGDTDGVAYYSDGMLVYPYGRISLPITGDRNQIGVTDAEKNAFWNINSDSEAVFDGSQAKISHVWGGASVDTVVTANADGALTVVQRAKSSNGISGVSFGLSIPNKYDIILPIWGGVRLTAEQPDIDLKFTRLTYPDLWQAQMFLIQGANGGLLVYAEDNATQFKALGVLNDDFNFYLTVETIPQAPFDQYGEFETVSWRMIPYKGDWNAGAMLYREFANKTFDLDIIQNQKPGWASGIRFVFLTDIEEPESLDELAKYIDPSKTLLIVPGFRKLEYDTAYPDYTPKEVMKGKIDYAKSLGYHVGLHFNMLGAAFDSPEYISVLKDYHSLDAFTGEPVNVNYTAYNKEYSFAHINPAAKAWRDIMVKATVGVVRELGVDAIHFDESLLCHNDGRGLVDGMTSLQGNVEFQKDLAQALPGVAFSGEGVNEMNMRYASWLQVHVYGLNSNTQTWDNAYFDQICPLTTMIFDDYVSLYHYPAMPVATRQDYYMAWHRAGSYRTGHMPTIMRQTLRQLRDPNEALRTVLKEARWFQENQPKLNTAAWGNDTIISWVKADGNIAEYRRDAYGEVFMPDVNDAGNVLTRIVTGVENAKLPGSITGWLVYDDVFIRGLDPKETYLYNETPRNPDVLHISEVPENITLQALRRNDGYTTVNMREITDTSKTVVDFMKYAGTIRAGEVMNNGETHVLDKEFNSIYAFWYTMQDQGQVRHLGDRLLMHPPWHDSTSIGFTYIEFDVPLEICGNALFEAGAQMASKENADAGDGVIFTFYIWAAGDETKSGMVTHTVEAITAFPTPVSLDIVRFEGKTVTVRIECDPGPTTTHDSSVIVSPRIIQRKASSDREITYTIVSDTPVTGILSTGGKGALAAGNGLAYDISAFLSDTVYLIHGEMRSSVPGDLATAPYTCMWISDQGDIGPPADDMAPSVQTANVNGDRRMGILSPPPLNGRCELYYIVTLPAGHNTVLTGAAGLTDGSDKSDGVVFEIMINGDSIWESAAAPNEPFEIFEIDLSGYAGQTVLLTLCVHSAGDNIDDNAFWSGLYLD